MKIYVSEKENINLKFNKKCELVIFDSKPAIKLMEPEFSQPIKTSNLLAYSLEQHEEEIRKQERQRVITELEDWIEENKNDYCEDFGNGILQIDYEDLRQKLNEMKRGIV